MRNDTDHHDEEISTLDDQEYQRRVHEAISSYVALEIDAWQEVSAQEE